MTITAASTDEKVDDFLQHFGVLGMHWGVHRSAASSAARATNATAKKDAKRLVKSDYTHGRGTRAPKMALKSEIASKKLNDPAYAKAVDRHYKRQSSAAVNRRVAGATAGLGAILIAPSAIRFATDPRTWGTVKLAAVSLANNRRRNANAARYAAKFVSNHGHEVFKLK